VANPLANVTAALKKPQTILIVLVLIIGWAVLSGRGPSTKTRTLPDKYTSHGRTYVLHTEHGIDKPRPLVIVLHGWNQSADEVAKISGASGYGDRRNFSVVYPMGIDEGWNAGGCCGDSRADDVQYLADVVDDAAQHTKVDRKRVYIWGFSNGGMMAWRAACARRDVFAAAGVVSGALLGSCADPVRVRHIHGSIDDVVPYHGGVSGALGVRLPDSATESARVKKGSTISTVIVPDVGHAWPKRDDGLDATSSLWAFDSRYRS